MKIFKLILSCIILFAVCGQAYATPTMNCYKSWTGAYNTIRCDFSWSSSDDIIYNVWTQSSDGEASDGWIDHENSGGSVSIVPSNTTFHWITNPGPATYTLGSTGWLYFALPFDPWVVYHSATPITDIHIAALP